MHSNTTVDPTGETVIETKSLFVFDHFVEPSTMVSAFVKKKTENKIAVKFKTIFFSFQTG